MSNPDLQRDLSRVVRQRVRSITILIVASWIGGLVVLFALQVVDGKTYRRRAHEVAQRVVSLPAQRGEIFDRSYDEPLVTNRPSFAVDIVPAEIGQARMDGLIRRLGATLGMSGEAIRGRLPAGWKTLYQPVEVRSGVAFSTISYLAEHLGDFPGVTWHSKPIRSYLEGGSVSHVLGYVGDITPDELQVLYNEGGYDASSTIGKSGVEKEYDEILRGRDGERYRTVDANGRSVSSGDARGVAPVNGKNIVLTIDRHIQRLAEQALGKRMGSVVVLRPSTGEVLALVSYPFFDPNEMVGGTSGRNLDRVFRDGRYPFLDRAIQSSYAPASTFKIIMSAADLEEKILPPERPVNCTGKIRFGGRTFTDWKPGGHGPLNLAGALAESCDIYFWTLGRQYLGIDRIVSYARRFGLGAKTGIDLPGEVAGLVPTPAWKERTVHRPWVGGDTMNVSIGQGNLLVTPIQMADVVAMVANRGVVYAPHVLKEVRDPVTGDVTQRVGPTVLRRSTMRRDTFDQLARNMRGVVTEGTAKVVITTKAVKVAGKTGTGEVGVKDHFTSWFAAYGPYGGADPADRVVVVVMVEATNPWEWWAPKAASIIFQGIFDNESYAQAVTSLEPAWYLNPAIVGDADH